MWEALQQLVMDAYKGEDKAALMYMIRTTLFHKPQDKFFRKSPEELWDELPPRKSLFYMNGLAIGNLPSQLWANLMGAIFTWWIMHEKGYKNFIIFVDDFRVLVRSEAEGRRRPTGACSSSPEKWRFITKPKVISLWRISRKFHR